MAKVDDVDKAAKLDRRAVGAAEAKLAAAKDSRASGREAAVIAKAAQAKPGFLSWKN